MSPSPRDAIRRPRSWRSLQTALWPCSPPPCACQPGFSPRQRVVGRYPRGLLWTPGNVTPAGAVCRGFFAGTLQATWLATGQAHSWQRWAAFMKPPQPSKQEAFVAEDIFMHQSQDGVCQVQLNYSNQHGGIFSCIWDILQRRMGRADVRDPLLSPLRHLASLRPIIPAAVFRTSVPS